MSPSERDGYIKGLIAKHRNARGSNQKWSDDEVIVRREAVYYWMGRGKSKHQLKVFLSELWDCEIKSAARYVLDAEKALCQQDEETIQEFRLKQIEKLQRIADDALEAGDRKSALAAYDQINKLNAAYTSKVEADVKGDMRFDFGE